MAYASLSWLIVELCKETLRDRATLPYEAFLAKAEATAMRMFEYGGDLNAIGSSCRQHRKKGEKLPGVLLEVLLEATQREHENFSFLIDSIGLAYVHEKEGDERDMALNRTYTKIAPGTKLPTLFSETCRPKYNVISYYFTHGLLMDREMKKLLADPLRKAMMMEHFPSLAYNEKDVIKHYLDGNSRY